MNDNISHDASCGVRSPSEVLLPLTDLYSLFQVGEGHTPAQFAVFAFARNEQL